MVIRALRPFRPAVRFSVLVVSLCACPAVASDAVLARVDALAAAGAPELALRVLDEAGTSTPGDPRWEMHERRRLELYRSLRDPERLAIRLRALPDGASAGLRRHAAMLLAEASMEAGDGDGAREVLRSALADASADERTGLIARLAAIEIERGRVRETELLLGEAAGASTEPIERLRAEIDLRSDRPRAALARAAALGSPPGRLILLTAALRAGARPPGEVMAEAQRIAQAADAETSLQRAAWLLRAEAARRAGHTVREASSLERALALPDTGRHAFLRGTGDDLLAAYHRLAAAVGRSAGLREGDATAWLAHAHSYAPEEGYYARAVYAFVAQAGDSQAMREAAEAGLADSLMAAGLPAALEALYPPASRTAAPVAVRQRLLDAALARGDYKAAVSLMDALPPPAGDRILPWKLRRARTLLYAGYRHEALVLLSSLLDEPRFDEEFAAAYLQVVFDLQSLSLHDQALVLLEAVQQRLDNARMQRELLYWRADSLAALGRHAEAAEHYLRSATHGGASPSDPWGQAARFHAAEALGRARLVGDARAVYASLLKQTADPARRAAIEQQMQQLWLAGQRTTP